VTPAGDQQDQEAGRDPDGDQPARQPLTTKEGWQRFVQAAPVAPPLLPIEQWQNLQGPQRAAYDQARIDHHARLVVVKTPTIRQVIHTGRQLVLLNRHQISARRGMIVTGPAATGKTTAITQLGKAHEQHLRRREPAGLRRLVVVYVTVPPAATPKMLAVEFARFLGLPVSTRANQADVTNAVCDVLGDVGTELVLVDEIHNLNLATRAGAEASDQLKYLSERIPATFVYAGIDVERVGLFAGTRGRQIAGRFVTLPTGPFPYGTTAQRQEWQALTATLEDALHLHRHRRGSLLELDAYLHQRSGGMIGSLAHLIRAAAIEAISDQTEQITKPLLDRIRLDHAAQASQPTASRSVGARRTTTRASNGPAAG
jgi:Bacterial TniB protein